MLCNDSDESDDDSKWRTTRSVSSPSALFSNPSSAPLFPAHFQLDSAVYIKAIITGEEEPESVLEEEEEEGEDDTVEEKEEEKEVGGKWRDESIYLDNCFDQDHPKAKIKVEESGRNHHRLLSRIKLSQSSNLNQGLNEIPQLIVIDDYDDDDILVSNGEFKMNGAVGSDKIKPLLQIEFEDNSSDDSISNETSKNDLNKTDDLNWIVVEDVNVLNFLQSNESTAKKYLVGSIDDENIWTTCSKSDQMMLNYPHRTQFPDHSRHLEYQYNLILSAMNSASNLSKSFHNKSICDNQDSEDSDEE